MKRLYVATISLSAFLLFSVEPMAARALLPQMGGSSAVWLGALAFFQLVLLLGYGYSAFLTRRPKSQRAGALLHIVLLLAACVSLITPGTTVPHLSPAIPAEARLFLLLTVAVGFPFWLLSSSAPLLQVWYARVEGADVPYRFFAFSNAASLCALLAYPFLIEPHLGLRLQFTLWRAGFVLFSLGAGALAWRSREAPALDPPDTRESGATAINLLWFLLPAVASMQLAAVTAHLTEDVASIPLLWIVPLAAYLLSFIAAFEFPGLYRRTWVMRTLAVLLFALGYFFTKIALNVPIGISIVLFTAELFFAAWFCHAELFHLRPAETASATSFYLLLAAGGTAGTLIIAFVTPLLTDSNFDLPIAFLLTAAIVLWVTRGEGWPTRLLWGGGTAYLVYVLVMVHGAYTRDALFRGRNFYGSLRVRETQYPPQALLSRSLYNGRIQHGMQWFSTPFHHVPLTYYTPDSGIGLLMEEEQRSGTSRSVGVIGLGAGTLAAYGRAGDSIRFFEINPMVTDVAQHLFTYTRDTPASVEIVPGDARLSLAGEPVATRFDVLVVDAFSGDSIPTHLLTREAMELYLQHLRPGGVLAFHVSNQYLDLAPVVARLAEAWHADDGLPVFAREVDSGPDEARGEALASWILVTQRGELFQQPSPLSAAKAIQSRPDVRLWTDDRLSLLPILRWMRK